MDDIHGQAAGDTVMHLFSLFNLLKASELCTLFVRGSRYSDVSLLLCMRSHA